MKAPVAKSHGQRTCSVAVSPGEVDAGADLTLTVRVTCPEGCDLTGLLVSIRDPEDAELASAELAAAEPGDEDEAGADDDAYVAILTVPAPLVAGAYGYRAVVGAAEIEGASHSEVATPFSFVVIAHAAHMSAWGMPAAIAAGDRFTLQVGIKCSCGCNLAGRPVDIFDHAGLDVGAGTLGGEPWPGTTALYFADVEVRAPDSPGYYDWSVTTPAWSNGKPHAPGSFAFGVRAVEAPDTEVTVEAFDSEKQTPIKGIHVLLHPYRAFTDENGVARVKVAKGRYKLVISGLSYVPYESAIEATKDVTARAELAKEPPNDGYFGG